MGRRNIGTQRRKEIIVSFYEVACEIGLENTSIAKLAQHLKISKGLVLHYFTNRDELLLGLVEYILEQHLNVMASDALGAMDSREKLAYFIEHLFSRKWNRYFDDGVFYSCYALIYRTPLFKESFRAYLGELHLVLYKKLEEAAENRVIFNPDMAEITEVIFALIDGAYYYLGMFEESEELYVQKVAIYTKYSLNLLDFNSE